MGIALVQIILLSPNELNLPDSRRKLSILGSLLRVAAVISPCSRFAITSSRRADAYLVGSAARLYKAAVNVYTGNSEHIYFKTGGRRKATWMYHGSSVD